MASHDSRDRTHKLTVLAPDEALRRARPLPDVADMALGDIPDDDWDAFIDALAEE